jgi:hypothetical protein
MMEMKMVANYGLIGRKGHIVFPEMQAEVAYLSNKALHWKTTGNDGKITEGDEKIDYKQLAGHLHFLNWIERDGWTVSQIIDTKKGEVSAYWSFHDNTSERGKRSSTFLTGQFKYVG